MHFGKQIKGLPVIALSDGRETGRVEDLIVNREAGEIYGLVLESGGIIQNGKYVLLSEVVNIGRDAVTIASPRAVREDTGDLIKKCAWTPCLEENVFTADGTDIGAVKDILLDFPGGLITGIEVSGGLWADINEGRKMVPWEKIVSGSSENIIVDSIEENIWS